MSNLITSPTLGTSLSFLGPSMKIYRLVSRAKELRLSASIVSLNTLGRLKPNTTTGASILVSAEDIAGIYFFLHIVKDRVVTVGDDSLAALLECCQIVYDLAAKECATVW